MAKKEQDIISKNLYGPNGVKVTKFISSLEKETMREVLELLSRDSLEQLELSVVENLGLVVQLNRAVDDALQSLERFYTEAQREEDMYQTLQDAVVYVISNLITGYSTVPQK